MLLQQSVWQLFNLSCNNLNFQKSPPSHNKKPLSFSSLRKSQGFQEVCVRNEDKDRDQTYISYYNSQYRKGKFKSPVLRLSNLKCLSDAWLKMSEASWMYGLDSCRAPSPRLAGNPDLVLISVIFLSSGYYYHKLALCRKTRKRPVVPW